MCGSSGCMEQFASRHSDCFNSSYFQETAQHICLHCHITPKLLFCKVQVVDVVRCSCSDSGHVMAPCHRVLV